MMMMIKIMIMTFNKTLNLIPCYRTQDTSILGAWLSRQMNCVLWRLTFRGAQYEICFISLNGTSNLNMASRAQLYLWAFVPCSRTNSHMSVKLFSPPPPPRLPRRLRFYVEGKQITRLNYSMLQYATSVILTCDKFKVPQHFNRRFSTKAFIFFFLSNFSL